MGHKRIARLMRKTGIRADSRCRRPVVTTRRDPKQWPAWDLDNRRFTPDYPNHLWIADMPYVPTSSGFIRAVSVA